VRRLWLGVAIVVVAMGSSGCAAIGLTGAALGAGLFNAGASAAVRAGTEITRGGVVYRTFSLPQDELRTAVGDTLAEMEIAVLRDELQDDGDRRILAQAKDRDIEVKLQPVTRTVTRLRLVVSEGRFRRDRATAAEIVAQTERAVNERLLMGAARGTAASSLARGARR
jgi:hypothetical protein